ncbi:hypothetical protein BUALT_Bualt01G0036700 [Buddleja alternifolia]|uniref:Peptidase C1A papain C-terminal domain-containing protein n=1 Tax=Buddleja alternifolia TaxID=168488 RepID=A0AAV6YB62_9LAMI|nr:hypothetical protein BUALT_Bualt01G0036700 [Buddleja alternifolia]
MPNIASSIDWRKKGAVTSIKKQRCDIAIGAVEGVNKIVTESLIAPSTQQILACDHRTVGHEGANPVDAYEYVIRNGESCWEFSAVGAVEGVNKIVTGSLIAPSTQQILAFDHLTVGHEGANPVNVYEYVIRNGGITTDKYYTYTRGWCKNEKNKEKRRVVTIDSYSIIPWGNESLLLRVIAAHPVSALIAGADHYTFKSYTGGMFRGKRWIGKKHRNLKSCWEFSVVGVVEGVNKIVTGSLIAPSTQQILACDHRTVGHEGANPIDAYEYVIRNGGITTNKYYTYTRGWCKEEKNKEKRRVVTIDSYSIIPLGNESLLLRVIAAHPVSALIAGADHYSFKSYTGVSITL